MAEIGTTLRVEFSTRNLTTGALANADALPTAVLRRNGTTVAAAAVTVSNLTTGKYLAEVALSSAHGWVVGDSYAVDVAFVMGGVSDGGPIAQGLIGTGPADGSVEHVHTVYKPGGATPLQGCSVFVSTDEDGENRSPVKVSDSLGRTVWQLNAGSYYFHHSHPDYVFGDDPDLETVS